MKNPMLLFWMAVLCCFIGISAFWIALNRDRDANHERVTQAVSGEFPFDSETPLEDFELTDQQGKKFGTQQLKGKIWIASFFFTSCASVCREMNMEVANLTREFEHDDVHFVSITVDPQRDTPTQLAAYADLFRADADRWHFLTGEIQYIKRIGGDILNVSVEKETHSNRLIVIDQRGNVRYGFRSTDADEVDKLKTLVQSLLSPDPTEGPKTEFQPTAS